MIKYNLIRAPVYARLIKLNLPISFNLQTQLQKTTSQTTPNKSDQLKVTDNTAQIISLQLTTTATDVLTGITKTVQPSSGCSNGTTSSSPVTSVVRTEQKPVECNLCHRKFKNIPALNGHMRLHGGYFKKESDAKKCDKKESSGPPLQTASIGVRALIEEKIISKRSRDLKVSERLRNVFDWS